MSGLTLENVSIVYDERRVVSGLNLQVEEGEFVVLLGASGSGKTSILRAVAGFLPLASGSIFSLGRPLDELPVDRRNVGVVFQDYALFPHMSVRKNIEFGLRIRRIPNEERRKRVDRMLELVALSEFSEVKPGVLSGGQKQRVALGRALVYAPSVLLMDEPLAALDRKLRSGLQEEIRKIVREAGITTLYVTHDQEEAFNLADRVAILQNGRLTQVATPSELYDRPSSFYTARFVGDTNAIKIKIEVSGGGVVTGKWIGRSGRVVGSIDATSGDAHLSPGTCALGVVRPENIMVLNPMSSEEDEQQVTSDKRSTIQNWNIGFDGGATIKDARAIGAEMRYELDIDGEFLIARQLRTTGSVSWTVGDRVHIRINQDAILALVDEADESSLSREEI